MAGRNGSGDLGHGRHLGWTLRQYDADYVPGGPKSDPVYTSPSDKSGGLYEVRAYDAAEYYYNGQYQTNYSDFGWFMGHGHSGRWMLTDATYGQASGEAVFKASEDVGTNYNSSTYVTTNCKWNQDPEWIFFNMCLVLANDDTVLRDWGRTMMGSPSRLHGIFGFNNTISGNTHVAYFLDYSTISNYTIAYSWRTGANQFPDDAGLARPAVAPR